MKVYRHKHLKSKYKFKILKAVIKFLIEELTFCFVEMPKSIIQFNVDCINKYDDWLDTFHFGYVLD